ncbi:MAG: hypothetical protein KKE23_03270 [Nanoarchaeota archaeon]|nr:hypothetical protein [Nanoarchaeota archaeon]
MEDIIEKVKKKSEFSQLQYDLVKDKLDETLRQNPSLKKFLGREKSEGHNKIIKLTREKLHRAYGVFQIEGKVGASRLLEKLSKVKTENELLAIHDDLLKLTLSTKERLPCYKKIYEKIFEITGWPKSIIDLGCGFNPMSFPLMGLGEVDYYAYDINGDDIKILNEYFKIMGDDLNGKAALINLEKVDYKTLPKADVGFLFKVFDVLDRKDHKKSEEIIKSLDCKWIIASFSTQTVSGKKMKHPHRGWIDKMLERIGYEFKIIEFENEIFYVIKK